MGFFKSKKGGKDDPSPVPSPNASYEAPAASTPTSAVAAADSSPAAGSPTAAASTSSPSGSPIRTGGRPPTSPAKSRPPPATASPPSSPARSTGGGGAPATPTANYESDTGYPTDHDGYQSDAIHSDAENDPDHPDREELDEDLEWDEGGPSQCGYSEPIHSVLMSAGSTIHRIVGDPGEGLNTSMRRIGNFFQEASYAVRDVVRGDGEVKQDAHKAWKEMVSGGGDGGAETDYEGDDHHDDGDHDHHDDVDGHHDDDEKENGVVGSGGSAAAAATPTSTSA